MPKAVSKERPVAAALRAQVETPLRREGGEQMPVGSRGARTRDRLVRAAYETFTERGYQASSVALIAERAGVGTGTFYQYFRDRADVLAHLVNSGVALLVGSDTVAWRVREGRAGLRRMLGSFVATYADHGAFWAMWEEATHIEPQLAAVRRDLSRLLEESVARELRRGRSAGALPRAFDPAAGARALTAMVDRFCYLTYVFDPADPPMRVDLAADLLTNLWADAIGLPPS